MASSPRGARGKPEARAEFSEMIAQIFVAGAHRLGIWRAAARAVTPVDLLLNQVGRHLIVELAVEPVHQPARLGARQGLAWEQLEASSGFAFAACRLVE